MRPCVSDYVALAKRGEARRSLVIETRSQGVRSRELRMATGRGDPRSRPCGRVATNKKPSLTAVKRATASAKMTAYRGGNQEQRIHRRQIATTAS